MGMVVVARACYENRGGAPLSASVKSKGVKRGCVPKERPRHGAIFVSPREKTGERRERERRERREGGAKREREGATNPFLPTPMRCRCIEP